MTFPASRFTAAQEKGKQMVMDLSRTVREFVRTRRIRRRVSVSARGTESYAGRAIAEGLEDRTLLSVTATLGWSLKVDNNSDGKVNPGDTVQYTATVGATGSNATGVQVSIPVDPNSTLVAGSLHISPIPNPDTYNWVGNTVLNSTAAGLPTLFSNDVTLNAAGGTDTAMLASPTTVTTAHSGSVTIDASTGAFTYTPPVGYTGSDSFSYTLANSAVPTLTNTATVTFNLSGRVWYVQNATANGNGESNSPFNSLASATAAATLGADDIYVFSDIGANPSLDGNAALKNGQTLLGQGVALTVNAITLFSASTAPTLTNSSGDIVTLGSGNTVSGLVLGNRSGFAIKGTTVGSLTVNSTSITGTGSGVSINGGALSVTLSNLSASGVNGVNLNSVSGSFTASAGSISGTSASPFVLTNSTASVEYDGSVTNSTTASIKVVDLEGNTGGTDLFKGKITDNAGSGAGIFLNSNTGATINFSGGVVLSTGAKDAFTATGGGTVIVSGNSNTLATTTGTALNVGSTTIGAGGLNFLSISVGTGASGPAHGIILSSTGTTAGLTVSGSGSTRASGGTIQHTTGDAVSLTTTLNPSFTDLKIDTPTGNGFAGTGVNGLTLNHVDILNPGGNVGNGPDGIEFDTNVSGSEQNLIGAVTISDTVISQHNDNGISILNNGGTLNLTINNDTKITGRGVNDLNGGNGILVVAQGTATVNVSIVKGTATTSADVESERQSGIDVISEGTSSTANVKIDGALIQGVNGASGALAISSLLTNHATFNVTGSQFKANLGDNIVIFAGDSSTMTGFLTSNAIDGNPSNLATNPDLGRGIAILGDAFSTSSAFTLTVKLDSNTVSNSGAAGIFIQARHSTSSNATVNATVVNNTVNAPGSTFLNFGTDVQAKDSCTVNTSFSGNHSTGSGGGQGYRFATTGVAVNNLYKGNSSSTVVATVMSDNLNVGTVTTTGTVNVTATAPTAPPNPVLLTVGGAAGSLSSVKTTKTLASVSKIVLKKTVASVPSRPRTATGNVTSAGISFSIATLPAGVSVTAVYQVVVNNPLPAGVHSLSVQGSVSATGISPPVVTDDPATAALNDATVTPLVAAPDLAVTLVDSGPTSPGGTVVYTIDYSNAGNIGSTGVKLTETVPTNATFNAGASAAGWSLVSGSTYQFTVGSLAGGGGAGSVLFAVNVNNPLPAGAHSLSDTVTIADDAANGSDSNTANNTATKLTTISAAPDLSITLGDGGVIPQPGGTIAYLLTYNNTGNIGTSGTVLTETVPANTTFNSAASTPGWTLNGSTYTFNLGTLAAGGTGSATFAVTVNTPFPVAASTVTDTAGISDDGTNGADSNPANNSATVTTTIGATVTGVSVGWGTSGSAALVTAADGVRLLAAGRSTDINWLGINRLTITLSHAATLAAGDVHAFGTTIADYGPIVVSGSGNVYTLTLSQPINAADRVRFLLGNNAIPLFSRRLDVLPGDFNDDGFVNSQDIVGERNQLPAFGSPMTIFGDVNGDGTTDMLDYNAVRQRVGTVLPAVQAP